MDIKDIKYISTIVEMASFSKASKKLYISQPALSQGIRRIEAELGVTLFVRDRTKVRANCCGVTNCKRGHAVSFKGGGFNAIYHIKAQMQPIMCVLDCLNSMDIICLEKTLKSFQQIEPSWEFHVVEGESHFLEQQICDGLVDVGLFPTPIYSQDLESYPVLDEQILLAISVEIRRLQPLQILS